MDIPGFQVKRTIGRGGMATAYLAVQESLDREVVLKVLNAPPSEQSDFLERFINEGRFVASLNHPHIITIHDIGTAGDVVYISMEYVEGGDLKARIHQGVPPDKALDLLVKIGRALGYAHGRGIIHRDVKPANILFRADGTALLGDFGIAKQVSVDNELTSTGTILGSPFYMSPEQSEGIVVDGRTDIYSLGVILYEMLTGERPYQGDSAIKVIMQHIQSPLPSFPEEFRDYQPLLAKMMAKDRDARFADAAALVEVAEEYQERFTSGSGGHKSGTARAAGVPGDGQRHSRMRLRVAALLAGLVIVLLGFGGIYLYAQTLRPQLVTRPAPLSEPSLESGVAGIETAPAMVAIADGSVGKQGVSKALGWLAKNSIRENRLTQPPADNAFYYYSRLLALDPRNAAAKQGFTEIAERFVVLAEEAFSSRDYGKAQAFIALGLQVEAENDGLKSLQSFIENREKSVLETFLNFFRS